MDEKVEINIRLQFEEFKLSFDKKKKVSSIRNDKILQKLISQKLGIEDIKLKYEFYPSYDQNELIDDWIKKEKNPKVVLNISSKSESSSSRGITLFGLNLSILDELEKSRHESLVKQLNQMEEKHDLKLRELNAKVDQLVGEINMHPLLDFVSKFRSKIIEQLVIEKKIPSNINNWNSMYNYLKENHSSRQLWSIIDEVAEELGLNYEDWLSLRSISSDMNSFKHPNPRLSQKDAYEKINTLRLTRYDNYQAPFKNLIDLFEKKNWQ